METTLDLGTIFQRDEFTADTYRAVKEMGFASNESLNRLRELLAECERRAQSGEGNVEAASLKLGLCRLAMADTVKAVGWLERVRPSGLRDYHLALAHREMGRHSDAMREFEAAAQLGWDAIQCACQRAETLLLTGDAGGALGLLESLGAAGRESADWHYVRARLHEDVGLVEAAIEEYEKALHLEAEHAQAMFRLALLLDLHGSEERALEWYETCADLPYVYIHAMMNLAVVYEDRGEYAAAARSLRRVLAVDPGNTRAQLYLKDVQGAGAMYIDEQQQREEETRNAVLDIPVSDFELSVRSRNCLKKMSINTLGDLLRISEDELLAYKNFGETSLREIKAMLAQKGLSLGQHSPERPSVPAAPAASWPAEEGDPEVLGRLASTLQLSVRSRKCLQTLGVVTVGDLVAKSEAELLSSRNFGQTSLSEIKAQLTELGVSLRPSSK
jgi:DNA-directed RNA polymerase subunit alpha